MITKLFILFIFQNINNDAAKFYLHQYLSKGAMQPNIEMKMKVIIVQFLCFNISA